MPIGKETGGSSLPTSKTEESAVTEERIAHILHEASAALRAQQVDVESGSEDSKSPRQDQVKCDPALCVCPPGTQERVSFTLLFNWHVSMRMTEPSVMAVACATAVGAFLLSG